MNSKHYSSFDELSSDYGIISIKIPLSLSRNKNKNKKKMCRYDRTGYYLPIMIFNL